MTNKELINRLIEIAERREFYKSIRGISYAVIHELDVELRALKDELLRRLNNGLY